VFSFVKTITSIQIRDDSRDGRRHQSAPVFTVSYTAADFGRRDLVPGRLHREPGNSFSVTPGRFVVSAAGRYQKPVPADEVIEEAGRTIVPGRDSLRRIPAENERNLSCRTEVLACLRGDFGIESAVGNRGRKSGVSRDCFQHRPPVVKSGSFEPFMRERPRQYPDHFIGLMARHPGDVEMGDGGRVPGAGKQDHPCGILRRAV